MFIFQYDALKIIGGESGAAIGNVVNEAIFDAIFDKTFLARVSWTGKSSKKDQKKIKLKDFKRVITLIVEICIAACKTYTKDLCERHIIYHIVKYAYRETASSQSRAKSTANSSTKTSETQNNTDQSNSMSMYPQTSSQSLQPTQTYQPTQPSQIWQLPQASQSPHGWQQPQTSQSQPLYGASPYTYPPHSQLAVSLPYTDGVQFNGVQQQQPYPYASNNWPNNKMQ